MMPWSQRLNDRMNDKHNNIWLTCLGLGEAQCRKSLFEWGGNERTNERTTEHKWEKKEDDSAHATAKKNRVHEKMINESQVPSTAILLQAVSFSILMDLDIFWKSQKT